MVCRGLVLGEEFVGRSHLMGGMEMRLEGRRGRWIVEVNVEEKLVVSVREALAKLALDRTVAGTNVGLQDFAKDLTHVFDLG